MTDRNSPGINRNEGLIARAQRRNFELNEQVLTLAKREAEEHVRSLGREPSGAERIAIEQICTLNVRSRALRRWGLQTEADSVAQILMKSLGEFQKMRLR
jgi:hypothetical protein